MSYVNYLYLVSVILKLVSVILKVVCWENNKIFPLMISYRYTIQYIRYAILLYNYDPVPRGDKNAHY